MLGQFSVQFSDKISDSSSVGPGRFDVNKRNCRLSKSFSDGYF
jgi:hypothetical protein